MSKKTTEKNKNEWYFEMWLNDLKKLGLVKYYDREPTTFTLYGEMVFYYSKNIKLKKKVKTEEVSKNLFRDITYTPDYKVVFTKEASEYIKKLVNINNKWKTSDDYNKYKNFLTSETDKEGNYIVYFDVKPPSFITKFSVKTGSSREFPIKQRLMWLIHNIYVNKVIPLGSKNCLFESTFYPERYKLSDKGTRLRKIKKWSK